MSTWHDFRLSFAGKAKYSGAFRLLVLEEGLQVSFVSKHAPKIIDLTESGQFFEGLWRKDCGELWLASPENGRYIEINLAPNGAWWACVFASPRVRDLECAHPKCENITCESSSLAWQSSLVIPWQEVFRCLQSEQPPLANVTLILGGCPDVDPPLENLHSAVTLGAVDFHRPQDWVPLQELL